MLPSGYIVKQHYQPHKYNTSISFFASLHMMFASVVQVDTTPNVIIVYQPQL